MQASKFVGTLRVLFTLWLGGVVLAASAILLLVILNSGWFARSASDAPIIYRPPVDPLARDFVYFFALAPAVLGSLIAGIFNLDRIVGGAGVALLVTGLAVLLLTVLVLGGAALWAQERQRAAMEQAVAQAEDELRQAVSPEVATVVALGLEAYSGQ